MTDEMRENRPPEKEEAAPAPASALGTATTSNDVTDDITISHGDAQGMTKTNIAESPAEDAGTDAPAEDPSAPRPTSAEAEYPDAVGWRRQQLREDVVSHLIGRRRPGHVLKGVDKKDFAALDDGERALVRAAWEGNAARSRLKRMDADDAWRERAVALYYRLHGADPAGDEAFEGYFERFGREERLWPLAVAYACKVLPPDPDDRRIEAAGLDLGTFDEDEYDERLGRDLLASGFGESDIRNTYRRVCSDYKSRSIAREFGKDFRDSIPRVARFREDALQWACVAAAPLVDDGNLEQGGEAHKLCLRGFFALQVSDRNEPAPKRGSRPDLSLDRLEEWIGRERDDDPARDEALMAIETARHEAEKRRAARAEADEAARSERAAKEREEREQAWRKYVAECDPWGETADVKPFISRPDGWFVFSYGAIDHMIKPDAVRAIWQAMLDNAVANHGTPRAADGTPDVAAIARFLIKAFKEYVLAWDQRYARKDSDRVDPFKDEKDPALAIRWSPDLTPDQVAEVIALAFGTDGGAGSLVCKDGVLMQFGDHGLEPVEDATGTKHVEGRVRGWVVEACPSADERAMDAAVVRLKHLVPQLSTRDALDRHEIDVNSWWINEGANVITSVGPNAYRMRTATPQDFVRCQPAPGAHYVATSEPDDDGWMDCKPIPCPRRELPNVAGEVVSWHPKDQAETVCPEHPDLFLDAQLQRTSAAIRSANIEKIQAFFLNVGVGGAGKTFDREWTTTMLVGVDHPGDRRRLVGNVGVTEFGDDNKLLTLVGTRLNWKADMGANPRVQDKDYERVKALTGGESVVLNRKWDSSINSDAVATFTIANSNNEVQFPSYDADLTRRQKRLPYDHKIPDEKKIPDLMVAAKTDPAIATWYFDQAIHKYPTFDHFYPNELMDRALEESVAEADTLSQQVKGALSLLHGSWVPVDFAYQFIQRWVAQNMSNTRIASIQRVKKELPRVLKPLGLVYVSDQFRWRGRFSPEVNAAAVHSLCEPQIRYDQDGREVARDYRPAALANWADAVETAVGGRDRLRGWIVREDAWEQWTEAKTLPDPNSGVALVDEETGGSADADDARERAVYERVYVPLVAGLAALGAKNLGFGPLRALGFDGWRAAGCPSAVALREQLTEAEIRAVGEHPELALSAPFGASAGAGVRVVYLVERSPELALTAPATVPCLDVAYLVVSGRAEIAAGNAPAMASDPDGDDPDDDPTPGPGAAPTSSDASEDVKTPDETAAQGTCDASAPADGAHEAPASSGRAPAANGPSAPAEAPVSAAPAAVEGGDAAEEAPGAPDPGYERFCAHAKGAVEHSGGYVVHDGGPEGTTVCREVIGEDKWAAYGRPTRVTRTVEVDGERLPLIE